MRHFKAVVDEDMETGLFVGRVPGIPGIHSQAETLDELKSNVQEVIEMRQHVTEPLVLLETKKEGTCNGSYSVLI